MFTRSSPTEQLVDGVKGLIADAEELLSAIAVDAEGPVRGLRSRLEESLRIAKRRIVEGGRLVADASRETLAAADRYTRANPWKIITIAMSIGFLLGAVTGRARPPTRGWRGHAGGQCGRGPRGAGGRRTE